MWEGKKYLQNDKYISKEILEGKRGIHTSTVYVKLQPSEPDWSLNKSIKNTTILQTDFTSGSEQDRLDLSQQVNIPHCEKQSSSRVHWSWILIQVFASKCLGLLCRFFHFWCHFKALTWKRFKLEKMFHCQVERKEKQLRGETAARQQLELQLDRLANQVFSFNLSQSVHCFQLWY